MVEHRHQREFARGSGGTSISPLDWYKVVSETKHLMSRDSEIIPTKNHCARLSKWQQVEWMYSTLSRLLPYLDQAWPVAPAGDREALSQALDKLAESVKHRRPVPYCDELEAQLRLINGKGLSALCDLQEEGAPPEMPHGLWVAAMAFVAWHGMKMSRATHSLTTITLFETCRYLADCLADLPDVWNESKQEIRQRQRRSKRSTSPVTPKKKPTKRKTLWDSISSMIRRTNRQFED